MDHLTPAQRSKHMRRIRSKDSGAETVVRRMAHGLGYRFRLHRNDLPGKPDLVFPRLGKIVFVHGCFWHSHHCRAGMNRPSSNVGYWTAKLERNRSRDQRSQRALRKLGWSVMVVWECQVTKREALRKRLERFLEDANG